MELTEQQIREEFIANQYKIIQHLVDLLKTYTMQSGLPYNSCVTAEGLMPFYTNSKQTLAAIEVLVKQLGLIAQPTPGVQEPV
jgi:hypothetical protein